MKKLIIPILLLITLSVFAQPVKKAPPMPNSYGKTPLANGVKVGTHDNVKNVAVGNQNEVNRSGASQTSFSQAAVGKKAVKPQVRRSNMIVGKLGPAISTNVPLGSAITLNGKEVTDVLNKFGGSWNTEADYKAIPRDTVIIRDSFPPIPDSIAYLSPRQIEQVYKYIMDNASVTNYKTYAPGLDLGFRLLMELATVEHNKKVKPIKVRTVVQLKN